MASGWLGLDWGNVPAWIGSVLTSASVLVAALAYRRSVSDKERGQASQIGAWVALLNESGKERRVARVSNSSNAPVYEVIVRFQGLSDLNVPELIAGSIATLELPANFPKVERSQTRTASAGIKMSFFEMEASRTEETVLGEESPEIQFRDALGRWWRRDSTGRLSKVAGPTRITTSTKFHVGR